ncbi:hypothetical protein B7755_009090 [Streptomyces sp. NBS 14/10]|uniref:hypothetical protein n=1 Tax=Streptomyces sp. NBS 14/10 TaxID=1945643 RepID=UPI00117D33A9|nr:hypothetical protein [Streptomyces sp. NBS 14/10]KAK1178274.1 hypothetical protein B7755_009090 [Streptomyces sp. NBS 14/10]
MSDVRQWKFRHEDGEWLASAVPPANDNLTAAIETLVVPFGESWQAVESYLESWDRMEHENGFGYSLSTPGAVACRVSKETVEICDLYDQFEDTRIPEAEFISLLRELSTAMRKGA